jgi:hypothetical protein
MLSKFQKRVKNLTELDFQNLIFSRVVIMRNVSFIWHAICPRKARGRGSSILPRGGRMRRYSETAWERAMKVQEVILRAGGVTIASKKLSKHLKSFLKKHASSQAEELRNSPTQSPAWREGTLQQFVEFVEACSLVCGFAPELRQQAQLPGQLILLVSGLELSRMRSRFRPRPPMKILSRLLRVLEV